MIKITVWKSFNTSGCRWNETNQMVQSVQPELQLNMNSQGGFVPQFINHTNRSETVPSPIQSDSSIQVPFRFIFNWAHLDIYP